MTEPMMMEEEAAEQTKGKQGFLRGAVIIAAFAFAAAMVFLTLIRPGLKPVIVGESVSEPVAMLSRLPDGREPPKVFEMMRPGITIPTEGDLYATIRIGAVGIEAPVYYGDTEELLKQGVGTYTGGGIPGQNRTILMGGHNNTDFLTLPQVKAGDVIEIETDYGDYFYLVTDAKELRYDDPEALDLYAAEENIVLYTCTQSIPGGATPWRWFVYGSPME